VIGENKLRTSSPRLLLVAKQELQGCDVASSCRSAGALCIGHVFESVVPPAGSSHTTASSLFPATVGLTRIRAVIDTRSSITSEILFHVGARVQPTEARWENEYACIPWARPPAPLDYLELKAA